MPELRVDPVSGHQVLIAPGRGARPHTTEPDLADPRAGARDRACPFCPGHEAETPPETARTGTGAPGTAGWRTRVFPNKFPIVGGPAPGPRGGGVHEVLVLSPDHGRDLARLTDAAAVEVFTLLRDRARTHAASCAHVAVFVNHGRAAGASIAHPHAQIVGVGFVPDAVAAIASRFASAPADLVLADLAAAQRATTAVTDGPAPVWCPPAAASPYELRVAALTGGPRFELAPDDEVAALAVSVRRALDTLHRVLGDHAYNVVVHTGHGSDPFHWFVSIVPRVAVVAGFEFGTGVFVNTVAPESAAAELRSELR